VKSNLDNEIEILKSRTLLESTVRKLNLNINLISAGNYQIKKFTVMRLFQLTLWIKRWVLSKYY
jgi:uncharacterized protein involved in exopolysaccharide biosynthesis